jgi:hypothetical protein
MLGGLAVVVLPGMVAMVIEEDIPPGRHDRLSGLRDDRGHWLAGPWLPLVTPVPTVADFASGFLTAGSVPIMSHLACSTSLPC